MASIVLCSYEWNKTGNNIKVNSKGKVNMSFPLDGNPSSKTRERLRTSRNDSFIFNYSLNKQEEL